MGRTFYDLSDCLSNATSSFEFNKRRDHLPEPDVAAESASWGLGPSSGPTASRCPPRSSRSRRTPARTSTRRRTTGRPGRSARTIDEVPLEWCYGDGVLLDFRGHDRVAGITRRDVEEELARIGTR